MKRGNFKSSKGYTRSSSKTDYSVYILLGLLILSSITFIFISQKYNSSYEPFENEKKTRIEYYYKDGCPHCDSFKPIWDLISNDKELLKIVDFKEYDLKKDGDRASKFLINSIPEIISVNINPVTPDKELKEKFEEDRTVENLKKFIKKNA